MNYEKPDAGQSEPRKPAYGTHRPVMPRGSGDPGGRRWLFLLVDILLLAAIAAAVLFAISLLTPFSLFGDEADEEVRGVAFSVELAGVDRSAMEILMVGNTVTDGETGSVLGTVVAVDSRPYTPYSDRPSDEPDAALDSYVVKKDVYPDDLNTVTVTIRLDDASYLPGVGYRAGDSRLAVGRTYTLRFPGYTGQGVCLTLQEVLR